MKPRDPEQDWLPHCVVCDGRHTRKETCEQFLARLKAKAEKERAA